MFQVGHDIRPQLPLALDDRSEPEPDLAVVRGEVRDYLKSHPGPEDTVLVVEVADSSLRYDQTEKLAAYARAEIPEYWILNLLDGVLEVYREPVGGEYLKRNRLGPQQEAAQLGHEAEAVVVAELLP